MSSNKKHRRKETSSPKYVSPRHKSSSPKESSSRKPSKRRELDQQCWYHGLCSRESVEPLLTNKGDFLVRASETQGSLAIIISLCTGKKKSHLTVAVGKFGTFYLKAVREAQFFRTVYDLVRYYQKHSLRIKSSAGKVVSYRLQNPIPRPKWLVRSDNVIFDTESKLGSGNFAIVYKGTFLYPGANDRDDGVTVAVKVLKEKKGNRDEKEAKKTMIREGEVMSFYSHANVVQFYGVGCDRPQQIILVMEYCPGGSLEKHLQSQKSDIVVGERLTFCLEAALGMRYLHSQGCIHRDLAARNCLISSAGVVKIADFGLSVREGFMDKCDLQRMPVRWMAPETLIDEPLFSTKSDVWAYGILVFEIFNEGDKPWKELEARRVATHIRKFDMPAMPEASPEPIKALVKTIWVRRTSDRPSFIKIVEKLRGMQKGDLRPPPLFMCSVNRLPGVSRPEAIADDSCDDSAMEYLGSERSVTTEKTTITTSESVGKSKSGSPTRREKPMQ